jgi:hypothetical protein
VSIRMTIASIIVLNSVDIKLNIFFSQSWILQSLPDCWPAVACLCLSSTIYLCMNQELLSVSIVSK